MRDEKIIVIGDEDAVFGLGLIGLPGHVVSSVEEARRAIERAMADPNTALVLLTENWSEARPQAMAESGALVVEIPSQKPAKPAVTLEEQIERALGARLER
jgi:vacuolar-type H+-ATPase subunit F/Vma7